ncbi:MAG: MBL fold metallo-hydrolase [Syntrophobacterales bacterium]|nr:MBL fold metallo-hydrolase [Syntrophobacterales bacterium]
MEIEGQLDNLRITVVAEDSVQYESSYLGQHGISMLLEAGKNGVVKRVLVDVAQNPDALLENMAKMDISPASIDVVVLTHCHYDHTRGLAKVLGEIGKKNLPVIAHPDIFRLNFITDPFLRHVGVMDGDSRKEIEAAGGMLCLTKEPMQIMPGLITTGEIARVTDFEKADMSLFTVTEGEIKNDMMLDDISVAAHVKEKGIIVVTGCGHAGIINILRHICSSEDERKIHGIIGGLHLIEAPETRIMKTVQGLKEFRPDWIAAGHCTGFRTQVELFNAFKDRFSPLCTGMVVDI